MKKSDATKQRLLEAATAEFSTMGFAGARIDRIATSAGCNKQAIYGYFGSKDGLYAAVYEAMVADTIEHIPIDAFDLPGYAVRLFDWYAERPEVLRLAFWSKLESSVPATSAATDSESAKVLAIQEAQIAGAVTDRVTPHNLLAFVLRLSTSGMERSPDGPDKSADAPHLRQCLHEAVSRMVAP